jgi:phosphate-selective porin
LGVNSLQLVLKYDWYDPNKKVKGKEVDALRGFTAADIRYNTLGVGFLYYINVHVKAFLYYDFIKNESTNIKGFENDIKDNILTFRLQYRF